MKISNAIKFFIDAFFRKGERSEFAKYISIKKISEALYPKYKFSSFGRIFLEDSNFVENYKKNVSTLDYSSLDRRYTLDQFVKQALPVAGDTAECGVFNGASSLLICNRIDGIGKLHHVFDSFEGISAPTAEDAGCAWQRGAFSCSEMRVRENLCAYEFVRYYKGWIPERFGEVQDRMFSFVHVDVDLYRPTLDAIAFFYDRMSPGGIMLCDDYGLIQAPGAKKAMDDFYTDKTEDVICLTTGQGMVIKSSHGSSTLRLG
ncbi:MAG: class I SAM-dependent methyltransferase [Desulfobacterales bacterium]|nr:class I SAM-dependent methyltransferase [Desulfobacterales bacterium]